LPKEELFFHIAMELGTNQKGMLAELKVRQRAMELGVTMSIPTDASARYDAILDDGQHLYRAQIKYCDRSGGSNGAVQIELTSYHRSGKLASAGYTDKEIDVLLLYVPRLDKILWLGPEVFAGKHAIQIRLEPTKNGQTKGCLFATDYLW
jgi:hypothetical protein